jgi:hypothetical protein
MPIASNWHVVGGAVAVTSAPQLGNRTSKKPKAARAARGALSLSFGFIPFAHFQLEIYHPSFTQRKKISPIFLTKRECYHKQWHK